MRLPPRPVVNLDRIHKAKMIEAFLHDALKQAPNGLRVLDIGSGNGDICAYFATNNFTVGVDIKDQFRPEHHGLAHCLARSEALPFIDNCFDVVISHHVIEHVDDHDLHISEIHRILTTNGICYLGTPNLTSPFMRGHLGNPMVLKYSQMRPLFERHGFAVEEYYLRLLHEPDHFHCQTRLGRFIPVPLLYLLRHWFPSQCFLLRPRT